MLRCMVGMILRMCGMPSSSVSMMPGGFVVTILVMLCGLAVMLGCLFVVFGGFLVVVRSLMVRHFAWWAAIRQKGQFGEPVMTAPVAPGPGASRIPAQAAVQADEGKAAQIIVLGAISAPNAPGRRPAL
jgi:hypothetical protein